jgi:hypothetical protein
MENMEGDEILVIKIGCKDPNGLSTYLEVSLS